MHEESVYEIDHDLTESYEMQQQHDLFYGERKKEIQADHVLLGVFCLWLICFGLGLRASCLRIRDRRRDRPDPEEILWRLEEERLMCRGVGWKVINDSCPVCLERFDLSEDESSNATSRKSSFVSWAGSWMRKVYSNSEMAKQARKGSNASLSKSGQKSSNSKKGSKGSLRSLQSSGAKGLPNSKSCGHGPLAKMALKSGNTVSSQPDLHASRGTTSDQATDPGIFGLHEKSGPVPPVKNNLKQPRAGAANNFSLGSFHTNEQSGSVHSDSIVETGSDSDQSPDGGQRVRQTKEERPRLNKNDLDGKHALSLSVVGSSYPNSAFEPNSNPGSLDPKSLPADSLASGSGRPGLTSGLAGAVAGSYGKNLSASGKRNPSERNKKPMDWNSRTNPTTGSNADIAEMSSETPLLPCGHRFHRYCLSQWLNRGSEQEARCPVCRTLIAQAEVIPVEPDYSVVSDSFWSARNFTAICGAFGALIDRVAIGIDSAVQIDTTRCLPLQAACWAVEIWIADWHTRIYNFFGIDVPEPEEQWEDLPPELGVENPPSSATNQEELEAPLLQGMQVVSNPSNQTSGTSPGYVPPPSVDVLPPAPTLRESYPINDIPEGTRPGLAANIAPQEQV